MTVFRCRYTAHTDRLTVHAGGGPVALTAVADGLRVGTLGGAVVAVEIDGFAFYTDYATLWARVGAPLFHLIGELQATWLDGVSDHDDQRSVPAL